MGISEATRSIWSHFLDPKKKILYKNVYYDPKETPGKHNMSPEFSTVLTNGFFLKN